MAILDTHVVGAPLLSAAFAVTTPPTEEAPLPCSAVAPLALMSTGALGAQVKGGILWRLSTNPAVPSESSCLCVDVTTLIAPISGGGPFLVIEWKTVGRENGEVGRATVADTEILSTVVFAGAGVVRFRGG